MNLINWLADRQNRRFVKGISYIALVLVVAADFVIHRHHVEHFWDRIPGFGAVYGLVSCVVIIIVSKYIGHAWLMKKEDYYD